MKEIVKNEVLQNVIHQLKDEQYEKLKEVLDVILVNYKIEEIKDELSGEDNRHYVESFLPFKRLEGCSEETLHYYESTIQILLDRIQKHVKHVTTDDSGKYLTDYQNDHKSSRVAIDNIRQILSSFFSWLEDGDYVVRSPVRRIHKVKSATTIKETYSDEPLGLMRDNRNSLRDLALIDILASAGMRVGELVLLNIDDINFSERECVVFGEGDKGRVVYFDTRTKIHLQNYINSRNDENKALFVSIKRPYNRLSIGAIETIIRNLGKQLDTPKAHPHKFRRTLTTKAIDKGMPIEQLQELSGHQEIDTTLQYVMVKRSNVKITYKRYIG